MQNLKYAALTVVLATGCAGEPAQRESAVQLTEPAVEQVEAPTEGTPVLTPPLPPDAERAPIATLKMGADSVSFFDARVDAMSNYAVVQVNDGDARWLDLHTDEERAGGASPESGWGWAHIAVAPDGRTLVGVLDWCVESSGPELIIVASTDGGHTWSKRAIIEKPDFTGLFESLEMLDDEWVLWMSLDDSCFACGALPSRVRWVSAPGGLTWSRR